MIRTVFVEEAVLQITLVLLFDLRIAVVFLQNCCAKNAQPKQHRESVSAKTMNH